MAVFRKPIGPATALAQPAGLSLGLLSMVGFQRRPWARRIALRSQRLVARQGCRFRQSLVAMRGTDAVANRAGWGRARRQQRHAHGVAPHAATHQAPRVERRHFGLPAMKTQSTQNTHGYPNRHSGFDHIRRWAAKVAAAILKGRHRGDGGPENGRGSD